MIAGDLDDVLAVLAKRAGELRSAGVRELAVGDVRVTLAPPDSPVGDSPTDKPGDELFVDPLDDPMTFGRRSGVPGFPRDEEQQ